MKKGSGTQEKIFKVLDRSENTQLYSEVSLARYPQPVVKNYPKNCRKNKN